MLNPASAASAPGLLAARAGLPHRRRAPDGRDRVTHRGYNR